MQTSLCSKCKSNGVTIRCSKEHLEKYHNYRIDDVYEIINKVADIGKNQRSNRQSKNKPASVKRNTILECAESLIQPNIEKLKMFLDNSL